MNPEETLNEVLPDCDLEVPSVEAQGHTAVANTPRSLFTNPMPWCHLSRLRCEEGFEIGELPLVMLDDITKPLDVDL